MKTARRSTLSASRAEASREGMPSRLEFSTATRHEDVPLSPLEVMSNI